MPDPVLRSLCTMVLLALATVDEASPVPCTHFVYGKTKTQRSEVTSVPQLRDSRARIWIRMV